MTQKTRLTREQVEELSKDLIIVTDYVLSTVVDGKLVDVPTVKELPEDAELIGTFYEDTPGYTSEEGYYKGSNGTIYRKNIYYREWSLD